LPRDTFFNLPQDKRDKIIDLALDEFALHDYRTASLSRIVEKAGIAKGSMYQYFDDKKELYLYLVKLSAETKFGFIDSSIDEGAADSDFFEKYKMIVFYGASFDFSRPRYANILYHATYEPSEPEIREISEELKDASYQYIKVSVEEGVRRGQLRNDLSVDFMVFALYQLTVALRDYLSSKYSFSFKKAVEKGAGSPVREAELKVVLDEFIDFFKQGLQAAPHPR
jgi:AcrR family transcriptional regulator